MPELTSTVKRLLAKGSDSGNGPARTLLKKAGMCDRTASKTDVGLGTPGRPDDRWAGMHGR